MKQKQLSPVAEAIIEMADGMLRVGIMDKEEHRKITLRHLGKATLFTAEPITGADIRSMRERAELSQAAFARYLNLSPGYIAQLERGAKQPTGPALAILNIIRRKGIEAIT
jgi:putative transcriptional regulator